MERARGGGGLERKAAFLVGSPYLGASDHPVHLLSVSARPGILPVALWSQGEDSPPPCQVARTRPARMSNRTHQWLVVDLGSDGGDCFIGEGVGSQLFQRVFWSNFMSELFVCGQQVIFHNRGTWVSQKLIHKSVNPTLSGDLNWSSMIGRCGPWLVCINYPGAVFWLWPPLIP